MIEEVIGIGIKEETDLKEEETDMVLEVENEATITKEDTNEAKLKTEELEEWLLITMIPATFVRKLPERLKTEVRELPAKTGMSTKKTGDRFSFINFKT